MEARELVIDAIGRSQEVCHRVLQGMDADTANRRPAGCAGGLNSITWLVWHIARQQDAQVAALAGAEQVWLRDGWVERFALDLPRTSMGYGHTSEQVDRVVVTDTGLLLGYLDAVVAATVDYVGGLDGASLDEVIDTRWTPPVTRGVRLVSIVDDAAQHAGQAAYVRGLFGL